jgi:hypothetical protein
VIREIGIGIGKDEFPIAKAEPGWLEGYVN